MNLEDLGNGTIPNTYSSRSLLSLKDLRDGNYEPSKSFRRKHCVLNACRNVEVPYNRRISYFKVRPEWCKIIREARQEPHWSPLNNDSRLCSLHFQENCFKILDKIYCKEKALPTLYLREEGEIEDDLSRYPPRSINVENNDSSSTTIPLIPGKPINPNYMEINPQNGRVPFKLFKTKRSTNKQSTSEKIEILRKHYIAKSVIANNSVITVDEDNNYVINDRDTPMPSAHDQDPIQPQHNSTTTTEPDPIDLPMDSFDLPQDQETHSNVAAVAETSTTTTTTPIINNQNINSGSDSNPNPYPNPSPTSTSTLAPMTNDEGCREISSSSIVLLNLKRPGMPVHNKPLGQPIKKLVSVPKITAPSSSSSLVKIQHLQKQQQKLLNSKDSSFLSKGGVGGKKSKLPDPYKKIDKLKNVNATLRATIYKKTRQLTRHDKKMVSLRKQNRELREQMALDEVEMQAVQSLKENPLMKIIIETELQRNKLHIKRQSSKGMRYSDDMKKLALTLYKISIPAYNFLRKSFALPEVSSVRDWINGNKNLTLDEIQDLPGSSFKRKKFRKKMDGLEHEDEDEDEDDDDEDQDDEFGDGDEHYEEQHIIDGDLEEMEQVEMEVGNTVSVTDMSELLLLSQ